MLKTVLFDLDGTLLPMNQDVFVQTYLGLLAKKMFPYGYDPQKLVKSIWQGTEKMVKNSGEFTNETVFWDEFTSIFGKEALKDMPIFEDFYRNEFQSVSSSCGYDPRSAQTVAQLHSMGLQTVLATNPVFPALATHSRVRWAGMQPEDFLLITAYENSHSSKPNPAYYRELMSTLDLVPEECLMVGNDVQEDMVAETLGMKVFLLTDCMIDRKNTDISRYPHGSFPELMSFIRSLCA